MSISYQLFTPIITASASILAAAIAQVVKIVSDLNERKRYNHMHFLNIRNELIVNAELIKCILKDNRTFGIKLIDKMWLSSDTSIILKKNNVAKSILYVYSKLQLFNTLSDRYLLIMNEKDYGLRKNDRLSIEHVEMINIAEEIDKILIDLLPILDI